MGLIAFSAAHTAWVGLGAWPDNYRDVIGNAVFLPPYLLAIALTLRAAERQQGQLRRTWQWISAALIAWVLGQIAYGIADISGAPHDFPSVADVGFLSFVPLFLVGVLHLVRLPQSRTHRLVFALDVLILLLTALNILLTNFDQTSGIPMMALAYPLSDLLLVVIMLVFTLRQPESPFRGQAATLALGVLAFAAAHMGYGLLSERAAYDVGGPIDPFWNWGAALFGLAAYRGARIAPTTPDFGGSRWEAFAPTLLQFLPYLAIGVSFALIVLSPAGAHYHWVTLTVAGLVIVRLMIAESHNNRLQASLQRQAFTDPLTSLPNRAALQHQLPMLVRQALDTGHQVAVLFVDLDRFKPVNDVFGHAVGDLVLREATARIEHTVGPAAMVARVGGDELVVVVAGSRPVPQSREVAESILAALNTPFELGERQLTLSASIGICHIPAHTDSGTEALRYADLAMYEAKRGGRSTWREFEPSWLTRTDERLQLDAQLRRALRVGEFQLHYQPVVSPSSGEVHYFEALLRWTNGELGSVSPAEFVPAAEQLGLIIPLDRWVLRKATAQLQAWRESGLQSAVVSVNISALQFTDPGFPALVASVLKERGLPGNALVLELTESALIGDLDASNATLMALRGLGVRVALDDFGTGYSSMLYLQRLQLDMLKIDQSFVRRAAHKDTVLLRAMVRLAHDLKLTVVAEGVETEAQRSQVMTLGCEAAQGYLFARPLPPEDAERLMRAQK